MVKGSSLSELPKTPAVPRDATGDPFSRVMLFCGVMLEIPVNLGARRYSVSVGEGLLGGLRERLSTGSVDKTLEP